MLGAITGSALAIATLLVLVGVPQFRSTADDDEALREPVTLPRPTTPVEAPRPVADVGIDDADTAADAVTAAAEAPAMLAPAAPPQPDATQASPKQPDDEPSFEPGEPVPTAEAPQWYAFWSPFRSEIAASGFVSRLQSVTGLDYRVVKVKNGVYEVAFAYVDEEEIIDSLAQISAATGLELADNR